MNALPDNLVPVLDIVSAIRWLAPPTDEEDEEGYENDDAPIAAMYEMSRGIPGFRTQCLDILHQQGAKALNRFILDWCQDKLGDVVDETRYLLYGIPVTECGFNIADDYHYDQYRDILEFICNLEGKLLDDDAAEPVTHMQLALLDTVDDSYDETDAWADYHDYNLIGDEDTDDDNAFEKQTELAIALHGERMRERLSATMWAMGNIAGRIYHSLTTMPPETIDPQWEKVGWAIGWLFSTTGNTIADTNWETMGEMEPPDWKDWPEIEEVIAEAEEIYSKAQEGLNLIRHNRMIRDWLAYNIKKCNSLRKTWSINAQDNLKEITWPALTIRPAETPTHDAAPV